MSQQMPDDHFVAEEEVGSTHRALRALVTLFPMDEVITRKQFKSQVRAIGLTHKGLVYSIFDIIDTDNDGRISGSDVYVLIGILYKGDLAERIEVGFRCINLKNNGLISKKELNRFFNTIMRLSTEMLRSVYRLGVRMVSKSFLRDYVDYIFKHFDLDGDKCLSFNEYGRWVESSPLPDWIAEIRDKITEDPDHAAGTVVREVCNKVMEWEVIVSVSGSIHNTRQNIRQRASIVKSKITRREQEIEEDR
eukprot:TRINITY_DN860_c0_g1_i1.p1 TRINITY_DN860_c0_g1~~TRINITY_DN860_c0_g1_i1.p1  ORF type:complete len:249 (+),score=49.75 TRINITY_DN860_c0_g1_i1:455-1201(+)